LSKYSEQLKKTTRSHLMKIQDASDALLKFETKYKEVFQPDAYKNAVQPYKDALDNARSAAELEIKRALWKYQEDERNGDKLDASKITPEMLLLTGNFNLSKSELCELFDTATNSTMRRLIMKYADDHGQTIDRVCFTGEDRAKAAEKLTAYCTRSLSDQTIADNILWNDANFDKVVPAALNGADID